MRREAGRWHGWSSSQGVIASAAKQSRVGARGSGSLRCARNDGDGSWCVSGRDLQDLLAAVAAVEQAEEGVRRVLESGPHVLGIFEPPVAEQPHEPFARPGELVLVIEHDEAL